MRLLGKTGLVADGADQLDGFERVGVVKLFIRMYQLGIGGDDPSVEGEVPSGHGGAGVVEAIEADGASCGSSQVDGDGWELVVDSDGEWLGARRGRGGMLEQFNGDGGETNSLL